MTEVYTHPSCARSELGSGVSQIQSHKDYDTSALPALTALLHVIVVQVTLHCLYRLAVWSGLTISTTVGVAA